VNQARVRVAVAEDHEVMRRGLASLIETVPGYELVGEASDGLQAMDLVHRTLPDVLIVDLMMPGLPGIEVVRRVAHRYPKTRVVVLSMHAAESHELAALQGGARAFVPKGAPASDLLEAIAAAAAGKRYVSQNLSDDAIEGHLRGEKRIASAAVDSYSLLTEREKEVLQLVAEGLKASRVAERLGISVRTVETHRAHLAAKLGLHSQNDVVRYAIVHKLVTVEGQLETEDNQAPRRPVRLSSPRK
jgi:DNA-binding NarL/FixJ family response regulator